LKWFIDENKELVVIQLDGAETRFIIHATVRISRKTINGIKGDWWGFNNQRIILNEELFDWFNVGLNARLSGKK
jgi:hypothetical protein